MSSSNPFRKKGSPQTQSSDTAPVRFPSLEAIDTGVPQASTPPPPTSFRSRDHNEEENSEPPVDRKAKVVKKVRVLSPPPLSPDSPEWPNNHHSHDAGTQELPYHNQQHYEVQPYQFQHQHQNQHTQHTQIRPPPPPPSQSSTNDPFINGTSDVFASDRETPAPPAPGAGLPAPSSTSFSKALQDLVDAKKDEELKAEMREEGEALKAANMAKGSLDVDAFRRLLMTGNKADDMAGIDGTNEPASDPPLMGKVSRLQEDANESDSSMSVQPGTRKKAPPPPPSSRHGKSIKQHAGSHEPTETQKLGMPVSTQATENVAVGELHQGGEAPGRPSEESEGDHVRTSKKPAPAPPPRRGHARAESKAASSSPAPKPHQEGEGSARSSMETAPAKSSNPRHSTHAPAPPPPRRPHAAHRLSSLQSSPTSATFSQAQQQPLTESEKDYSSSAPSQETPVQYPEPPSKSAPPPPPPARNTSVRRLASPNSVEAPGLRQASGESHKSRDTLPPPPPPPARKRGSSKGSMDGPSSRSAAANSVPRSHPEPPQTAEPTEPGHGVSILADLDALQREVDALRGKMG